MTPQKRLVESGRILILTYYYPPISAGPTFVIRALLRQFDPSSMTIFSGDPARYPLHRDTSLPNSDDIRRYDVPHWWPIEDTELRLGRRAMRLRARTIGNVLVAVRVAISAVRELRKSEVRALLAVYPKQHFLLAACLASLVSRKPLLVYFMDVYVEGLESGRRVARMIERVVASRADVVFAMSEPHRQHLEHVLTRRGRTPRVIELPHPFEDDDVGTEESSIAPEERPAIVFTGAVYDAQADSIRRLIAALDTRELADTHLHLFTQTSVCDLAKLGIQPSDRVHVTTATRAGARAAQRAADILFVPIAFGAKEQVRRTASPSKTPEYLAAGRPILVHAPSESYLARYATMMGFAEVVECPSEYDLARAARNLFDDGERHHDLARRAAAALERHRAPAVAASLAAGVALAVGADPALSDERTKLTKVAQRDEPAHDHDPERERDTGENKLDVA